MKKLLIAALSVAAICVATLTSEAQNIIPTSLNGGTNNVLASSTNTYSIDIAIPANTGSVTLQAGASLTGAGTSAANFVIKRSVDASPFSYVTFTNFSITMSGTTTNYNNLDIVPGGARFFRLTSVGNANATALTNISFTAGTSKWAN